MFTYPYDPRGVNEENRFEETFILEATDTNLRTVVLKHRPFFEGIKIYTDGAEQPLTLGLDYEYAYSLPELDESVARPVYCGITFINESLTGAFRAVGQHLGSDFYDPIVDILDYLIKQLNNPVELSWLNVLHRPALMPPTPSATSWADLLNKKYLASSITDINLSVEAGDGVIDTQLQDLVTTITAIYDAVVAFDYPSHVSATNPHAETAESIGAHKALSTVPDTVMLYGKQLRELTASIRAQGLSQSEIDRYVEKWASKPTAGVFVQLIAPNQPLFKTPNGETVLTFTDTSFTVKSNGDVVLAVGTDYGNSNGNYVEWVVGANRFRIESSGDQLDPTNITLNGISYLNVRTLLAYQDAGGSGGASNIQMEGVGISFSGLGTIDSPITAQLVIPKATAAAPGGLYVKSVPSAESNTGISTDALEPFKGGLEDFIPKTTTINGKPMTGAGVIITLEDIHLANVNNTADEDKPLSTALTQELTQLAPAVHKHSWGGLSVPLATPVVLGASRVATAVQTLEGNKAVSPSSLLNLAAALTALEGQLVNADPLLLTDYASVVQHNRKLLYPNVTYTDVASFYTVRGQRRNRRLSGTIDLQTTPMFKWMSPYNTLEEQWARSTDMALGYNLPIPAIGSDLDTPGTPITLEPGTNGQLNIAPYAVKEWVLAKSGKLRVRARGAGIIQIFVDGQTVAGGSSDLSVIVDVDPEQAHCVGIICDCADVTLSRGLWFDILDEKTPVAWSTPGITKIGRITAFCPGVGMRHYLYANLETGALFSRAEPIISSAIYPTEFLLGVVDIPAVPATVESTTSVFHLIDVGSTRELFNHQITTAAHRTDRAKFALTGSVLNRGVGASQAIKQSTPKLYDPAITTATVVQRTSWGLVTDIAPAVGGGEADYALTHSNTVMRPTCWLTPANPKAGGRFTAEGMLVVEYRGVDDGVVSDELLFTGGGRPVYVTRPVRGLMLRIKDDVVEWGVSVQTTSGTEKTAAGWQPVPYVDESTMLADADGSMDVLMYPAGLDAKAVPHRIAYRYRYDADHNTLVVLKDWFVRGSGKVQRRVRRYKFLRDVSALFISNGSRVGIGLRTTQPIRASYYNGYIPWVPVVGELELDGIHYLPSLVDVYASANDPAAQSSGMYKVTTASRPVSLGEYSAETLTAARDCAQPVFLPHQGGFAGVYKELYPFGFNYDLAGLVRVDLDPVTVAVAAGVATINAVQATEIELPLAVPAAGIDSGELIITTTASCKVWLRGVAIGDVTVAPGATDPVVEVIAIPAIPAGAIGDSAIRVVVDAVGVAKFNASYETTTGGVVTSYEPTEFQLYKAGPGTTLLYSGPYGTSRAGYDHLVAAIAAQK